MPLWSALAGCLLGFLLGMRHALEPDHLAAVSTLVAEERSAMRGALLGAIWGVGHSVALLVVGMILAMLQTTLPARLATVFEAAVAVMLIALGVRAIARAYRGRAHAHDHAHDHAHPHAHDHSHAAANLKLNPNASASADAKRSRWRGGARPLALGVVHGLAGSGALTALVLASLPSLASRLVYIALFGIGSVAGMALLSGLAGFPLQLLGKNPHAARWLGTLTGGFSTAFGVALAWPLLFGAAG
ncbi:MAG TPA: urease accessory protein [Polyangia bacterium]|nr:urease accessory protein [Polyangia bacterium]